MTPGTPGRVSLDESHALAGLESLGLHREVLLGFVAQLRWCEEVRNAARTLRRSSPQVRLTLRRELVEPRVLEFLPPAIKREVEEFRTRVEAVLEFVGRDVSEEILRRHENKVLAALVAEVLAVTGGSHYFDGPVADFISAFVPRRRGRTVDGRLWNTQVKWRSNHSELIDEAIRFRAARRLAQLAASYSGVC